MLTARKAALVENARPASEVPVQDNSAVVYAIALYDFVAESPDELSLQEGDPVLVVDSTSSPEWWTVRIAEADGSEKEGLVPSIYMEIAEPDDIMKRQAEIQEKRVLAESKQCKEEEIKLVAKEKAAAIAATAASLSGSSAVPKLPPRVLKSLFCILIL